MSTQYYAVHTGVGWASRGPGVEFDLRPSCLLSKGDLQYCRGTLYKVTISTEKIGDWDPSTQLPNLQLHLPDTGEKEERLREEDRPDFLDGRQTVGDEADAEAAEEVIDLEPEVDDSDPGDDVHVVLEVQSARHTPSSKI